MAIRSLATLLAAALILSGCNMFPTGPGSMAEPRTTDQLIPLHTGNSWHYRDLVSGSTVQPENDPWIITQVPRFTRCFNVSEAVPEVPCDGVKMDTYTDGTRTWTVTFDGILVGTMTQGVVRGVQQTSDQPQDIAVARLSLPEYPVVGRTYSWDQSLTCGAVEDVTTPAGTFTCYRFNHADQRTQYWWARGVGLVQKKKYAEEGQLAEQWVLDSYVLKN